MWRIKVFPWSYCLPAMAASLAASRPWIFQSGAVYSAWASHMNEASDTHLSDQVLLDTPNKHDPISFFDSTTIKTDSWRIGERPPPSAAAFNDLPEIGHDSVP